METSINFLSLLLERLLLLGLHPRSEDGRRRCGGGERLHHLVHEAEVHMLLLGLLLGQLVPAVQV